LWNAACTVDGTTIDGFATEGDASRAHCTASSTDSVPPDVTDPTAESGASSRSQAKPTRSFSIASRLGNDVGSSPLDPAYAATASRPMRSTSGSPES
jgi:hypothetical protein